MASGAGDGQSQNADGAEIGEADSVNLPLLKFIVVCRPKMSRRLLAIAFVAFFPSFASTQLRTAITSASVEGTVVTMPENRPVARAVVVLQPADEEETPQNRLITDADGHFLFKGLKPGRYSLHCGRQGLVAYADRDQFQELALVADQQLNGIVLRFVVGGVVTGRVFDKEGEPLQDV